MKYANRAGFFMNSAVGYKSFVPAELPPNPPIQYDDELQGLLSLADRKLGRLDGVTQILPNPELFVAMKEGGCPKFADRRYTSIICRCLEYRV